MLVSNTKHFDLKKEFKNGDTLLHNENCEMETVVHLWKLTSVFLNAYLMSEQQKQKVF